MWEEPTIDQDPITYGHAVSKIVCVTKGGGIGAAGAAMAAPLFSSNMDHAL